MTFINRNVLVAIYSALGLGAVFTFSAIPAGAAPGAPSPAAQARLQAIENFKANHTPSGGKAPQVTTAPVDGAIIFLSASPKSPIPAPTSQSVRQSKDVARQFLKENGRLFHEEDAKIDFKTLKEKSNGDRHYVRLNQTYGGLPVFGAQSMVQFSKSSSGIQAVSSDIMRVPSEVDAEKLSLTPTITLDQAKAEVLQGWQYRNPGVKLKVEGSDLMIYAPGVVGNDGDARLVYSLEVRSVTPGLVGDAVLVDAHEGIVVLEYALLHDAVSREIYDAKNSFNAPTLARSEGQGPSSIQDVNLAYDYFGHTYDFYFTQHQRDSLNGAGGLLRATVRYCYPGERCPYDNAFWDGSAMYFGEGYANADDVIAHELTHGVTDHESELIYLNQSGAINESFSDMWGEWIDQTNLAGNDSAGVKWLIGEDLPDGAFRNMANPTAYSHADKMTSPYWYIGPDDGGGVHWNSGVGNKLCYLLTDGGSFNGRSVSGFGVSKTAKLFYEVQANILTAGADYADLYLALKQAAINLNYSQADKDNLEQASRAVEIHLYSQPPANDMFANAVAVNTLGTVTGTNMKATKEPGEPSHAGYGGGKSVWWKLTFDSEKALTVTTQGSQFDTLLGVYTGSAINALSKVAANDDVGASSWSKVTFTAQPGVTYYVAVDGYDAVSGAITLNVAEGTPSSAPGPDLTLIDGIELIKKAKMQVKLTVANIGNVQSPTKTRATAYFSPDGTTSNMTLLKDFKLSKLKPQKQKYLKLKTKDASLWSGGYIIVDIDPEDLVTEQQEVNNLMRYGPLP